MPEQGFIAKHPLLPPPRCGLESHAIVPYLRDSDLAKTSAVVKTELLRDEHYAHPEKFTMIAVRSESCWQE